MEFSKIIFLAKYVHYEVLNTKYFFETSYNHIGAIFPPGSLHHYLSLLTHVGGASKRHKSGGS